MKKSRVIVFVFLILLITTAVLGAQEDCPEFVQETLVTVNELCATMGRDEACYGNDNLDATARVDDFAFSVPGDVADINEIESLRLAGLNLSENIWGVALMQVRANIAPDVSENVTIALFGDVTITNGAAPLVELSATTTSVATLYRLPNGDETSATLASGSHATVNGRLEDGTWLRVITGDERGYAWVMASALQVEGDVSTLAVSDGNDAVYGPMQAFYLQTGGNDRPCAQAPNSGILIQTPEGVGEINFLINEVDVRLGSTAYFSTPNQSLNIAVLEGHAEVTSEGETEIVEAGMYTEVPLDEDFIADGAPEEAEVYEDETLDIIAGDLLPEEIEEVDGEDVEEVEPSEGVEEVEPSEEAPPDEEPEASPADEGGSEAPPEEPPAEGGDGG